jgi:thiol-disulfide isomerase/thioredoxin
MAMQKSSLALALGLLLASCGGEGPQAETGSLKGVQRSTAGKAAPDVELRDADDEPATLADARGKPLLVNLWASWCAPCVKELPTLQTLSHKPGAPRVIAVSQDMAPRTSVDAFADRLDLAELEIWHDPKMALSGALDAQVLPTTILYDSQGRERWRYVGDLDWSGEEAAKILAEAR